MVALLKIGGTRAYLAKAMPLTVEQGAAFTLSLGRNTSMSPLKWYASEDEVLTVQQSGNGLKCMFTADTQGQSKVLVKDHRGEEVFAITINVSPSSEDIAGFEAQVGPEVPK